MEPEEIISTMYLGWKKRKGDCLIGLRLRSLNCKVLQLGTLFFVNILSDPADVKRKKLEQSIVTFFESFLFKKISRIFPTIFKCWRLATNLPINFYCASKEAVLYSHKINNTGSVYS